MSTDQISQNKLFSKNRISMLSKLFLNLSSGRLRKCSPVPAMQLFTIAFAGAAFLIEQKEHKK
jgi:hypothetical protein